MDAPLSPVFWPWWGGALAFFAITVGYFKIVGRPFGVSGAWTRVVFAKDEARASAIEATMGNDAQAIEDALVQATLDEFGPEAAAAVRAEQEAERKAGRVHIPSVPVPAMRAPWTESLVLLVCITLGGFLSAVLGGGGFSVRTDLGPEFVRIFGSGFVGPVVLLVGGVCVGFGTTMAGGCTSGHGLSGCSRFQLGSLLSTGVFFGTAVATAFALDWVSR